ncbi:hypothetical protein GCM10027614_70270 [Micromonospora vulcania]
MKMTSGDFNGDGRADLSAFYGYNSGNGDEAWINWIARPDGGFDSPIEAWRASTFGNWNSVSVFSGDVNGDGRDDVSLFYAYATGAMALITWPGQADGKFPTGYTSWSTPADKPFGSLASMKLADGDFNGDGRDDVAVLYNYGGTSTGLHTWTAKADGNFNAPVASWKSTSFGQFASIKIVSGDYNGDKRDDLAFLYRYGDESQGCTPSPRPRAGASTSRSDRGWTGREPSAGGRTCGWTASNQRRVLVVSPLPHREAGTPWLYIGSKFGIRGWPGGERSRSGRAGRSAQLPAEVPDLGAVQGCPARLRYGPARRDREAVHPRSDQLRDPGQ